jgi:hypothetical protein
MPPNWFCARWGRGRTGVAFGVADYRQQSGEKRQRSEENDERIGNAIVPTGCDPCGLAGAVR